MLLCSDGSYYIGHTHNVTQRFAAHQSGQGAAYTAARRPLRIVYTEGRTSEAESIIRERQLKRWSRAKKEALARGDIHTLKRLSMSRSKLQREEKSWTDK